MAILNLAKCKIFPAILISRKIKISEVSNGFFGQQSCYHRPPQSGFHCKPGVAEIFHNRLTVDCAIWHNGLAQFGII